MARFLRLGTATNIPMGPLVAVSDGYTYLATTITLAASAVQFNKGNTVSAWGAMASAAVSCPIPGWLSLPIPATDLNVVGPMNFNLGNVTGNLPVWTDCVVLAANVYDAFMGADFLDVNVTQLEGGAPSTVMLTYFATKIAVQVVTGVNVTAINGGAPTNITFNANVLTITGAAVSSIAIGSVANLTTGVAVTSIAAGVGVNVSSMAVGVNVSSFATGINVTSINGGAVSTVIPQYVLDYVMNAVGAQSLTLKDYFRVMGAALAGQIVGVSTPTGVHLLDPSGTVRVSAVMDSRGNRTSVSWVTG